MDFRWAWEQSTRREYRRPAQSRAAIHPTSLTTVLSLPIHTQVQDFQPTTSASILQHQAPSTVIPVETMRNPPRATTQLSRPFELVLANLRSSMIFFEDAWLSWSPANVMLDEKSLLKPKRRRGLAVH